MRVLTCVAVAMLAVFGGVHVGPTTATPATTAPTTATPTTPAPASHCSHGYWKNHDGTLGNPKHPKPSTWPINPFTGLQYKSSDPIGSCFPNSATYPFSWTSTQVTNILSPYGFSAQTTLHTALGATGGGINNVFRQGVAAYFDSLTYSSSITGYTKTQIINEFYKQVLNNMDGGQLEWYATFCHEGGISCPSGAQVPTQYQPIWGTCCPSGRLWDTIKNNCGSGVNPPGGFGDPQIGGFHGQSFQFHGLADEVFNLISTPTLQVNGHFVYLSSGKCDYTETACWTHPGTYIDQLGFSFGDYQVKLVAGSHYKGLHMELNGELVDMGSYKLDANGTDVTLKFLHHGKVQIKTQDFAFTVHNSDSFFNIETSLLDRRLLRLGAPRHTITDKKLCHHEETVDESKFKQQIVEQQHNHGAVESLIDSKYGGAQVPLHGLIGQTWRNVIVCGKHWVGSVSDYVASDLFADDYFFNFYHQE